MGRVPPAAGFGVVLQWTTPVYPTRSPSPRSLSIATRVGRKPGKNPRMPRLFLALSSHGYGHLAQVAPLVNALRQRTRGFELIVQADMPEERIGQRIEGPFRLVREGSDVGMVMDGPLTVLWEESFRAYDAFHRDWHGRLERQLRLYRDYKPDIVLVDVPYLPLAAAGQAGITAAAVCSLNWVDILSGHPVAAERIGDCMQQARDAYHAADLFLKPAPAMPMPWLKNAREIGPLAATGRNRRAELLQRLGLPPATRLALLQLGGIPGRSDYRDWHPQAGVHWLVAGAAPEGRGDFHSVDALGLPFLDLVCSVQVVVTKPGYGSFTEAACNGTPVLFVERHGWAEARYLGNWLEQSIPALGISQSRFRSGQFTEELEQLFSCPRPRPVPATGVEEGAALIAELLGSS